MIEQLPDETKVQAFVTTRNTDPDGRIGERVLGLTVEAIANVWRVWPRICAGSVVSILVKVNSCGEAVNDGGGAGSTNTDPVSLTSFGMYEALVVM